MSEIIKEKNIKTGFWSRTWRLPLPLVTEPNFYRIITSFSAFVNYKKKRNINTKKNLRYYCINEEHYNRELPITTESMTRLGLIYEVPEVIDVKDIYEFYTIIGYDKKTKKYI